MATLFVRSKAAQIPCKLKPCKERERWDRAGRFHFVLKLALGFACNAILHEKWNHCAPNELCEVKERADQQARIKRQLASCHSCWRTVRLRRTAFRGCWPVLWICLSSASDFLLRHSKVQNAGLALAASMAKLYAKLLGQAFAVLFELQEGSKRKNRKPWEIRKSICCNSRENPPKNAMSKDLTILGATRCCSRQNRWTCGTRPPLSILSRSDQFVSFWFLYVSVGKASGICFKHFWTWEQRCLFIGFFVFQHASVPGDAAVQSRSASLAARHFLGAYSTQEARDLFGCWRSLITNKWHPKNVISLCPLNRSAFSWVFIKSQARFGRKQRTFADVVRFLQLLESDARENVDTWIILKGPGIRNVDLLHRVALRPLPGALLVCNKHWAYPN